MHREFWWGNFLEIDDLEDRGNRRLALRWDLRKWQTSCEVRKWI